jgi:hypothetical protein
MIDRDPWKRKNPVRGAPDGHDISCLYNAEMGINP